MKKGVFLVLFLGVSGLYANSFYSIFVGSYAKTSDKKLALIQKQLSTSLASNPGVKDVVIKKIRGLRTLIVETNSISQNSAQNILNKIKATKYSDAYMRKGIVKTSDILSKPVMKVSQPVVKSVTFTVATNKPTNTDLANSYLDSELKSKGSYLKNMPLNIENRANAASLNKSVVGKLDLNTAIKNVLYSNPKMRESIARYLQTGRDLRIAKNAYYPTLDFIAAYGYTYDSKQFIDGNPINPDFGGSGIHDSKMGGYAKLVLNENIYNGGYDSNNIKKQINKMDAAAFYVNQTADRLTLEMVKAYIDVLKNKELLDIAKKSVDAHQRIFNLISSRTRSGYSRLSEKEQAGSRLTLAQSNLVAQENNYNDSLITFYKLYGKSVTADNLIMPIFTYKLPNTLQEVYERAIRCNPSVLIQTSNIKAANYEYKQSNAAFLPKVNLEASGGYDNTTRLYNNYNNDKDFSVMLKLNYNLFNKTDDVQAKQRAQMVVQQEIQNRAGLIRDLAESTKFSWNAYIYSKDKMSYLNKHLEYTTKTLSTYKDEFRLGRRDLINLLDAETEYFNAITEVENTKADLLFAEYRLLDNMGIISDVFVPGLSRSYTLGACSAQ